jgi:hypothetical protein
MECHYCDASAEIVVEKDDIRVGACERHFREQMEELADSEWVSDIEDQLDIDRAE